MMSEKRFKIVLSTLKRDVCDIQDTAQEIPTFYNDLGHICSVKPICELLNKLNDENERLRQMIKENVFGMYAEGSFADLKFKAAAYDDIIKLEISNKLVEPKLIVTCKRGKKENVQSFCRMFIPHGMYYEIKELEE